MDFAKSVFSDNVRVLKSQVTKTAYQAIGIAIASVIIATMLSSYYLTGSVTLEGVIKAQSENYTLWLLDCVPFVFGFWGQYSSSMMAYHAGAMIYDQTQELRSRAENLERQANYSATHDAITELPNRALFYDRVDQAILSASKQGKIVSVILIEVANFKDVYDTLGRIRSDLILKQVATRLQSIVAGMDSVGRIDGNIFGLLLSDVESDTVAIGLAKNIQSALEPAFKAERLSLSVHINQGIVHYPEHGDDVDTLVQKAGVALFMASKSHQGYAVYTPAFDDHSPRRLTLMTELRQAIERDELFLEYQPKINISSGEVYGAEALVRWRHPKHGMISPDEFIPMAERTRVIKNVTIWVLKQTFNQCARWHEQGFDLTLSVNLSVIDLHDPELPDIVAGVAAFAGIQPSWIMLEITESSIMNDPERTLDVIQRLHSMGYKLSIDDFGTGYSSLVYLRKMPLTELKIDKSFVIDILGSDNDAVIVNATINLAHNLGLQVTAEGVESQQVLEKLAGYGCDIAQGFYCARPLALSDFNSWLDAYQGHSKVASLPTQD